MYLLVVAFYVDFPYGLTLANWDQDCISKLDLKTMLDGFQYATKSDLHSVIVWVDGQIGLVRRVPEGKGDATSRC